MNWLKLKTPRRDPNGYKQIRCGSDGCGHIWGGVPFSRGFRCAHCGYHPYKSVTYEESAASLFEQATTEVSAEEMSAFGMPIMPMLSSFATAQMQLAASQVHGRWSGVPGNAIFLGAVPPSSTPVIDPDKLAALKVAEPYKVTHAIPDLIEVITAWRCWEVNSDLIRLVALGQNTIWEPKQILQAMCAAGSNHTAPQMDCTCGIWAFKELDALVEVTTAYPNIAVIGKVSLWGRVVETENGYRAQCAYPSELWLLNNSQEELGLIYDVPVRMVQP